MSFYRPRCLTPSTGAAASLREALEDTLTVQALGITGALYRTLRTTNPIANLKGSIATSRATSSDGRTGS